MNVGILIKKGPSVGRLLTQDRDWLQCISNVGGWNGWVGRKPAVLALKPALSQSVAVGCQRWSEAAVRLNFTS